jgi:Icc-related predicted phosphoesterase
MRVHVVSDVHGNVEALRRAGDGADALICLGDLLAFVDYADPAGGIMGELFGAEAIGRFIELRTAQRFADASAYSRSLWEKRGGDRRLAVEDAARRQYRRLFDAMPRPAYATFGNVDLPKLWDEFTGGDIRVLDGEVITLGGRRFGFVGGGLQTRYHTPYERSDEEFAAQIAAVGAVDVLCCHIPPARPELTYDVVSRRFERGSEAILQAIGDTQPGLVLFGHVHQPLQRRLRIGRTECVNVGHFRAAGMPYVVSW